nr:MAG TPA: collagen I alpha 1 [Caudoviricetes sp.]
MPFVDLSMHTDPNRGMPRGPKKAHHVTVVGERGRQGIPGRDGKDGKDGLRGLKGDKGDKGEKGDKGDRGLRGEAGEQGIRGEKGDKGDPGASFIPNVYDIEANKSNYDDQPKGFSILCMDTGNVYWKLSDTSGDWTTTPLRFIGQKGDKGDKGDTGEAGAKGDRGYTGAQGPRGATGLQGEKGEQGIRGLKGDKGEKGDKGDKGDVGASFVASASDLRSARSQYADQPKGFSFLAIDEGKLYWKLSDEDEWSTGFEFGQGEKGDKGDKGDAGKDANDIIIDPDPEEYFMSIYGSTEGNVLTTVIADVKALNPDPLDTYLTTRGIDD